MSRLLGLGFVFGAKDAGAIKTTKNLAAGMDRVSESVQTASRSAGAFAKLGTAISSMASASMNQLSGIGDQLERLVESTGNAADATSIESFGVEFSNTWRRATAGLGPFREQVEGMRGQISSMAYSLDVDAGQMISAVSGFARTGTKLEDYGLTLRGVAGAIQSDTLAGEQLSTTLTGLAESYDLGAAGAGRLLDHVTALGESMGFGAEAAKALPDIITAADPILARFSGITIDQVTDSVTRLALATQRRIGGTYADALTTATTAMTTLGQSRAGIADLVTGLSSDFPDLATSIAVASGDIDGAINAVMSSPMEFAGKMRDMYETMRGSGDQMGMDRLTSQLQTAGFDDNFMFLVQGGEASAEALRVASQAVVGAEGAFNRLGVASAGTSRTFGESMERLKDSFETNLRGMSAVTRREVLGRQRDAYRRLESTLDRWRGRGGILGTLTQGFIDVRTFGLVNGLLPSLDKLGDTFPSLKRKIDVMLPALSALGPSFMEAAGQMGPMLVGLKQMGVLDLATNSIKGVGKAIGGVGSSIVGMLGPWGIAIAAIGVGVGLLIYYWDDVKSFFQNTDWMGLAQDAASGFISGLSSLLDWSSQVREFVSSVDWTGIGQSIADGFKVAWDFVKAILGMDLSEEAAILFKEIFGARPEVIVPQVVATVREILQNTIGQLPTILHDVLTGIFGADSAWTTVFETMFAASPIGIMNRVLNAESIPDAILAMILGPTGAFTGPIEEFWKDVFGESIGNSFAGIPDLISGALESTGISAVFEDFVGFVGSIFDILGELWDDIIAPMADVAWNALTEIGSAFGELWDATIKPVFDLISGWWKDDFSGSGGIVPQSKKGFKDTGKFAKAMWEQSIRPMLMKFMRVSVNVATTFASIYKEVFLAVAKSAIKNVFSIIRTFTILKFTFENGRDVLAAGWEMIGAKIDQFFVLPMLKANNVWLTMVETIKAGFDSVAVSVMSMMASMLRSMRSFAQSVGLTGMATTLNEALTGGPEGGVEGTLRRRQDALAALTQQNDRTSAAREAGIQVREQIAAATLVANEARIRNIAAMGRAAVDEVNRTEREAVAGLTDFGDRIGGIGTRVAQSLRGALDGAPPEERAARRRRRGRATEVETPVVTARTTDGSGSAVTPRERATARRAATEEATAATRTETARATARAMVISSFGPEAARQLGTAFRAGPGRSSPRPGTSPGGNPADLG